VSPDPDITDPGVADPDPATVAWIRAAASTQARRRRWRHLFVTFAGFAAALVGEAGVIGDVVTHSGHKPPLGPCVGLFVAGTAVATIGWQRFNLPRALSRWPLTIVAIALLVPLLALTTSSEEHPSPDMGSSSLTASLLAGAVEDGAGAPLAPLLLDQDVVALFLGPTFQGPEPMLDGLVRSQSIVTYRAERRSLSLRVGQRRRIPSRIAKGRRVSAAAGVGGWVIRVSAYGVPADQAQAHVEHLLAIAERRLSAALTP
jgi:hypothetical protein